MKRWSRLVAILLVLPYVGIAISPYAYAHAQGLLRIFTLAAEVARLAGPARNAGAASELSALAGIATLKHNATTPELATAVEKLDEVLGASNILRIGYYFNYVSEPEVYLNQVLDELGFAPSGPVAQAWKQFPIVRKLEVAYYSATLSEAESPDLGGRLAFLAHVVRKISERYGSVEYDDRLAMFLNEELNRPIRFTQGDVMAPPIAPAPIKDIINAIIEFCGNCNVLGGMSGILKTLGVSDPYNLLRGSKSNIEALEHAVSGLPLWSAKERLASIVKDLQDHYPVGENKAFKAFLDWRPSNSEKIDEAESILAARRVDTQAAHGSK